MAGAPRRVGRSVIRAFADGGGPALRGVLNTAGRLWATLDGLVNDRPIRVAVTGLSRSGKTVFLTSLIANLLAMGTGRPTLPALRARIDLGGKERLRNIRLVPARASTTPRFDYPGKLADMAAPQPQWPARTEDLAEIELELEIRSGNGILGQIRTLTGTPRLRLELLDYPGEWLLDLPLLNQTHLKWSAETLARLREKPRADAAAEFLAFIAHIDPSRAADDALIQRGHRLYKAALERCRSEHGLRYLQPGRFLTMGARNDAPFMWFFPADNLPASPASGSIADLLNARFEAYKTDMRANFFDTHFRAFDRQIVLVDTLGALHAGRAAYEDTEHAIADIAACLAGESPILPRFLGGAGIERVAFVATKADHVPELHRDNLRALMRDMVHLAATHGPGGSDTVSYHAAASVVSTTDGWADQPDGHREPVVWGRKIGEAQARPYRVGNVPITRPPESFWSGRYFELPSFTPPAIDPHGANGIPHLGLDRILADLIGDRL
ncbi:MAG: ATPase [Acetobacteraceae bacterium]|nr:ATPase [Acetobacteraceae bacterium]